MWLCRFLNSGNSDLGAGRSLGRDHAAWRRTLVVGFAAIEYTWVPTHVSEGNDARSSARKIKDKENSVSFSNDYSGFLDSPIRNVRH